LGCRRFFCFFGFLHPDYTPARQDLVFGVFGGFSEVGGF